MVIRRKSTCLGRREGEGRKSEGREGEGRRGEGRKLSLIGLSGLLEREVGRVLRSSHSYSTLPHPR